MISDTNSLLATLQDGVNDLLAHQEKLLKERSRLLKEREHILDKRKVLLEKTLEHRQFHAHIK